MTTQFEDFKKLLDIATKDTNFVKYNSAMQDSTYATAVETRISALNEDYNFTLNSDNVETVNGLVTNDTDARNLVLNALAHKNFIVDVLEHDAIVPSKIWVRKDGTGATLSDGIRYIISSSSMGVLFLSETGELIGSLPGFGDQANDGYDAVTSAISFEVSSVEYVAVAMPTHSIVRIYAVSDWSLVTTIGTLDTPGLPDADDLTSPTDLAFDATNSVLYISDDTGIATGASGAGFVCSFDISTIATPVFGAYVAVNDGGKLIHGEISKPSSIFYDTTKLALWSVSLDDSGATDIYELGAIKLSTDGLSSVGRLDGYIKTKQYFDAINDIFVDNTTRKVYAADYGSVKVFDADTLAYVDTYGYYAQEYSTTPLRTPPVARVSFYNIGAIAADEVTLNSVSVNILVTGDANKILRISEDFFGLSNYAEFEEQSPAVPVALEGYVLKGSLPSQSIIVQYKTSSTGDWHTLEGGCNAEASTYYKFRVKLFAGPYDVLQDYTLDKLIIVGRQA